MKKNDVDILGDYYNYLDDHIDQMKLSENLLKKAFKRKTNKLHHRIKKEMS